MLQNPIPVFTKFEESVCDFVEYYVSSSSITIFYIWVLITHSLWLMGPIRGLRKKKKLERKLDCNGTASDSSEKDDAIDWWDDFSKRTNGISILIFSLLLIEVLQL